MKVTNEKWKKRGREIKYSGDDVLQVQDSEHKDGTEGVTPLKKEPTGRNDEPSDSHGLKERKCVCVCWLIPLFHWEIHQDRPHILSLFFTHTHTQSRPDRHQPPQATAALSNAHSSSVHILLYILFTHWRWFRWDNLLASPNLFFFIQTGSCFRLILDIKTFSLIYTLQHTAPPSGTHQTVFITVSFLSTHLL